MVQSGKWEWLLEGFNFDLETQVKPRIVAYYYDHARLFVRWAQKEGQVGDPRLITKNHILQFFHYITQDNDTHIAGGGSVRKFQRTERSRWPYMYR